MVARPGCKDTSMLISDIAFWLQLMPPTPCILCHGKWEAIGGGLCQVCRTVDRLACLVRSPYLPAETGSGLLVRLRGWVAEIQDLGELSRGVVPNPGGSVPAPTPVKTEGAGEEGPPAEPPDALPPGASAKAGPPEPPGALHPKGEEASIAKGEGSPVREGASSSRRSPQTTSKKKKKSKEKKSLSRGRKTSRRSRSGRSRRESPPVRYASPVRPAGSKRESSESENREALPRRKFRPRSPSFSPPRRRSPRPQPSGRPVGRRWEGPIPAHRREPPPGQGRHFGKNKGTTKKKRRAEHNRRRFWRGARR